MKSGLRNEALVSILKSHLNTVQGLTLKVATDSMRPCIDRGDFIVVEPSQFDKLKRGDIVLYSRRGTLFCHRLVNRGIKGGSQFLVTRGDGESYPGEYLDPKELLGRVTRIKKTHLTIDCNIPFWRAINKFLGQISFCEVSVWGWLSIFKRKFLGGEKLSFGPAVRRVIHLPAVFALKVLVLIWKGITKSRHYPATI